MRTTDVIKILLTRLMCIMTKEESLRHCIKKRISEIYVKKTAAVMAATLL